MVMWRLVLSLLLTTPQQRCTSIQYDGKRSERIPQPTPLTVFMDNTAVLDAVLPVAHATGIHGLAVVVSVVAGLFTGAGVTVRVLSKAAPDEHCSGADIHADAESDLDTTATEWLPNGWDLGWDQSYISAQMFWDTGGYDHNVSGTAVAESHAVANLKKVDANCPARKAQDDSDADCGGTLLAVAASVAATALKTGPASDADWDSKLDTDTAASLFLERAACSHCESGTKIAADGYEMVGHDDCGFGI